jgi:hypothetical protein
MSEAVPDAQATPTFALVLMVESARALGMVDEVGAFRMCMPAQTTPSGSLETVPLLLTVASLMSKPAPLRRIPPAVLLLTPTWSSRRMFPPSAVMPGEPPVTVRSRM